MGVSGFLTRPAVWLVCIVVGGAALVLPSLLDLLSMRNAIAVALLIWALAVWWSARAARGMLGQSSGVFSILALAAALLVLAATMILALVDRSMPAPPLDIAQTPFDGLRRDGEVLYIDAPIDFALFSAMKPHLEPGTAPRRIVLNSRGGNAVAGFSIARLMRELELETYVDEQCYSACTLMFISGATRTLGQEGALGFHGYRFVSHSALPHLDVEEFEARDAAFAAAQGVDPAFMERVFETPPDRIWLPGRDALLDAGVLTQ